MHVDSHPTGPYWTATGSQSPALYPRLTEDIEADVVVAGAGIVGLTAAAALGRAGKSVVVLEALRIGSQATARSTAKITSQHGLVYARLVRAFGEESARQYGQANEWAIGYIAGLVEREKIACAFERKPAYVYADSREAIEDVRNEASIAARLGLPAHLSTDLPAPLSAALALRFDDQAQFNPVRYLAGLAGVVARASRVFEMTRVVEIRKGTGDAPYLVMTEGGNRVRAADVIVATHIPVVPDGMFFARAYPFSHPMLAAEMDPARMPEGMFISADTPTRSFRMDASGGTPHIIAVGASYATGDAAQEARSFGELEAFLRAGFDIGTPAWRWTNEDFRSMDGLPFIGPATSSDARLHVATGFNAWGITNGTLAGTLLADRVLDRSNPWAALFDPGRIKPLAGGTGFIKGNFSSARHLVADRFRTGRNENLDLPPGQAVVAKRDGETVAAYRDDAAHLHTVSAVCTHMGCLVGWNATDRSWDCPCHGSRFDPDGAVLHGPAVEPLKALSIPERG